MAEIVTKRTSEKKHKLNRKSTRVDLTPMVDLGFLLITFFVFTTALTTPMAMNIVVPYDKIPITDDVCESCVLTVLLHNNNRIVYYEGDLKNDPPVKETGYAAGEIRNVLMQKMNSVKKIRGDADQFVLIIKPSAASHFKNFVDITDEVTICQVKRYYIDELNEVDKRILLKK